MKLLSFPSLGKLNIRKTIRERNDTAFILDNKSIDISLRTAKKISIILVHEYRVLIPTMHSLITWEIRNIDKDNRGKHI